MKKNDKKIILYSMTPITHFFFSKTGHGAVFLIGQQYICKNYKKVIGIVTKILPKSEVKQISYKLERMLNSFRLSVIKSIEE